MVFSVVPVVGEVDFAVAILIRSTDDIEVAIVVAKGFSHSPDTVGIQCAADTVGAIKGQFGEVDVARPVTEVRNFVGALFVGEIGVPVHHAVSVRPVGIGTIIVTTGYPTDEAECHMHGTVVVDGDAV